MLYNAFPKYLKDELNEILKIMSDKNYNNIDIRITKETIKYKLSDNSIIEIPYRIYSLGITDLEYEKLNEIQKQLVCCIYTRSNNGYIREKYLKKLLENFDYWAIPFIVKLCDEYVIEILEVIYDKLKDRENEDIKKFCLENKNIINRSYSRMISYWNEFYRDTEKEFHKYIGRKLYRECLGYNKAFEKNKKYKCPCCGFYTFEKRPNGNYDICPVCFWEDDPIQLKDQLYAGGANKISLVQGENNK